MFGWAEGEYTRFGGGRAFELLETQVRE